MMRTTTTRAMTRAPSEPTPKLTPAERARLQAEMVEFEDLAAWLQAIADSLRYWPGDFKDPHYVAATAADVDIAVDRIKDLEGVVKAIVARWVGSPAR